MMYNYKIEHVILEEQQDDIWPQIGLLEFMALLKVGATKVRWNTTHAGDMILTVHYQYRRKPAHESY